jgi:hypothetical protein
MNRLDYYQFPGFENIYLEDSYTLDIRVSSSSVEFLLLVVLTERHPLYKTPASDEQYCYRHARLAFPNVRHTGWIKKTMTPYTDANGEIDYGNIDAFFLIEGHYYILGDWGELDIVSDPPLIEIL